MYNTQLQDVLCHRFSKKIKKYVNPLPINYVAICIELHKLSLIKTGTPVAPTPQNIGTNSGFSTLFTCDSRMLHSS